MKPKELQDLLEHYALARKPDEVILLLPTSAPGWHVNVTSQDVLEFIQHIKQNENINTRSTEAS